MSQIVLVLCVYPFVLLMYFLLKNEAVPKKGMYYGVFLTKENAQAPEVEQIVHGYNRQMRISLWVLLLSSLPAIFIPWFSIFLMFWLVWLVAGIFAFYAPIARANVRLKELKAERGWGREKEQGEGTGQETVIERGEPVRRVRFYQFAAPCVLSVAVFVWALIRFHGQRLEALSIAVGIVAFLTILFYLVALLMDRQKLQIISRDGEVNRQYETARKNLWKTFWMACAWLNTFYTAALLFLMDKGWQFSDLLIAVTLVYALITVAFLWILIKEKRKLDEAYEDKVEALLPDDDDKWLWGMIYYNPKDKRSVVENRVGIGTTMNMAKPAGKVLGIFGGLTLLSLPLVCIWCILLEFVPIQLSVKEGELVASQIRQDYTVPVSIVENVELLEELPKLSKVSGTGTDTLQKGTFRIAEVGRCQVFLNPQNQVFIRFEAAGTVYYMSGYDDAETIKVYEELTGGSGST